MIDSHEAYPEKRVFKSRMTLVARLMAIGTLLTLPLCAQITPASVSLRAAGTQQFTVLPTGCLWQTPIGTVNLAGYYQAPLVIPFAMTTTVTCGSASATVSLTASSLPVAGLEYIRGGNFAGSIIVLSILPPLFASNGQFGINGAPVKCPPQGCTGLIMNSNQDGTVSPSVNTAFVPSAPVIQSGAPTFCDSQNQTTAYTCSFQSVRALAQYSVGMTVMLRADTPNLNGTCTLNIDNLGMISIKTPDGVSDLPPNTILAGHLYSLWYDGSVFRLLAGV